MVLARRIRKRGANYYVEAHGEILMLPTGDVGRWKRRFSERVLQETRKEAPTNKRPRWGHYGKPLKGTFTASTSTRLTKGGGFIYSAIGSNSPYASYVDQGTGIHNGASPWKAKILPPYAEGSPSLYEASWHPPHQPRTDAHLSVLIKGQKGQHFFDKGLDRAFRSVGDARYRAIDGAVSNAIRTFPEQLASFPSAGNTITNPAFRASLEDWRRWRDEAFNSGRVLGRHGGAGTRESQRRRAARDLSAARRRMNREFNRAKRAEASKRRSQERRDRIKAEKAKTIQKPKKTTSFAQRKETEKQRFLAAAAKIYGASNIDRGSLEFEDGYWFVTVKTFTERAGDGAVRPSFKEIRGKKVE